jgi:siderophore synthetase component
MHPLQAQALLLDPKVKALQATGQLRYLGSAGPEFMATSSVRTVYNRDTAWMPKFSLPVRITNSMRLNRRHELEAGVAVALLFDRAGIDDFDPRLGIMHDPAFITVDLPGHVESGLEVIFRHNPFCGHDGQGMMTVAALTAEPLPGQKSRLERLVQRTARERGIGLAEAGRLWLYAYLDCALDPFVRLYERFGIAVEAHQQNSVLDVGAGLPLKLYYRDSQGFYLSVARKEQFCKLAPELANIGGLFFDDREIRDRFTYYLVVNQIFAVIARLGHDGLLAESEGLAILKRRLKRLAGELTGAGGDFARSLLDRPNITAKANLTIRLMDVDELADSGTRSIYTSIPNPLNSAGTAIAMEAGRAIAS